jgi:replication factor A1
MSGEIKEEINREYEKIKDKLPYEDFLKKMDERKKEYADVSFMNDLDIARTITGEYISEANQPLSEKNESKKIAELTAGEENVSITGRIMHISNVKRFTSRKGKGGKRAKMVIADESGQIGVAMWTNNIKSLKNIEENDVIKLNHVDVKQSFGAEDTNEIQMGWDSTVEKLPESDDFKAFPKYDDSVTNIEDIKADMQVNVIARIIRIPRIRTFNRQNGKEGQVASLEIQDKTGKIQYTLWNSDTDLIKDLKLKEGDSVKILAAFARSRNGELSLSHSNIGNMVKGEFDVPDYTENVVKLGDAHEMRDVTIIGVVSHNYDKITFQRKDGSEGQVKSIEIQDETGSIRVTLWNDDADETKLKINQKDIIKIIGGNIEFDEYSSTGYRVNTNWNTKIIINPEIDPKLRKNLEKLVEYIKPVKVADLNDRDDEGEDVDLIGRIVSIYDLNEFQRNDGTTGNVRTIEIGDDTGVIRTSFWDEKAEMPLKEGDAVKLENARTRFGNYNMELSVGKTSRVLKPEADELLDIPTLTEIEDMLYTTKRIDQLAEGDSNVNLVGRVINLYDPNQFQRSDGTPGMVRTAELADSTGVIRASLWDEKAEMPLSVGEAVKINNPRVNFRNDRIELSVGRNTLVTKVNEDEAKDLPSVDEIEDMIYKSKNIGDIEEEDRNIRVKGEIVEAYGNNILFEMCPNCNKRVTLSSDNVYVCDMCGEEIEEPNYLMIISCVIEDETGTMRATFFRKSAEDLIKMTTAQVRDIIQKTGDEGSLEGKVDDLVGHEITVIADANFNDYDEEIRLNVKKVEALKL